MLRTLRRRVTAVALGLATALGGGWLAAGVPSPRTPRSRPPSR